MTKYLLIAILFLLYSCEKEIEISELNLSKNTHQYKIAVDTYVTTLNQQHYIRLTRPGDYGQNRSLENVSDAIVSISSDDNTFNFSETEKKGVYISDSTFAPHVGEVYMLYILKDNVEYTAEDSVISATEIDFSKSPIPKYNKNVTGSLTYFTGYRHSFGYNENAKWLWFYAADTISTNNPMLSTNITYSYSHIGGEPQGLFPDNLFTYEVAGLATDSITVYKYSISDKYNKYLLALFSETEWKAGIFSTVSGNLPTNMSEGGTGYFHIEDVESKKISVQDLLDMQ